MASVALKWYIYYDTNLNVAIVVCQLVQNVEQQVMAQKGTTINVLGGKEKWMQKVYD